MTHVATLMSQTVAVTEAALAAAAAVLPGSTQPQWLNSGVAADLPFAPPPGSGNPRWTEAVRSALAGAPIDVVVQAIAGRRKRLLAADMDSTIIDQECIDELAAVAGVGEAVAAVTAQSMRGAVAFEASLLQRVGLIGALHVAAATRVSERLRLKPGAVTLVRTMRANGAMTALVSGGFTIFTAHVARVAGFDRHFGNVLVVENGRLTGRIKEPILGRAAKRAILRSLRDEFALEPEQTLAVGDGANDLAMLEEAGLGVAFQAQPAVASVARARLDHTDLTGLLYLQGYCRAELVGG